MYSLKEAAALTGRPEMEVLREVPLGVVVAVCPALVTIYGTANRG